MRINDYLYHNDAHYRALVEERKETNWQEPIKPSSAYSDLQILRFPSGQWYLKYKESGYPQEVGGNLSWKVSGNTFEVNYLFDKIQTEFVLNRVGKVAKRSSVIKDKSLDTLWQVIWIDLVEHNNIDQRRDIPDTALLIYNNEQVWETTAQFTGTYYRFRFSKRPQYQLKDFV